MKSNPFIDDASLLLFLISHDRYGTLSHCLLTTTNSKIVAGFKLKLLAT